MTNNPPPTSFLDSSAMLDIRRRYQSSKDENWHSALEQSCDIVAVAGGDGIVGTVAKNLIGTAHSHCRSADGNRQ